MNNLRVMYEDKKYQKVPSIVYAIYKKKFSYPKIDEGFISVKEIQFEPNFDTITDKNIFLLRT